MPLLLSSSAALFSQHLVLSFLRPTGQGFKVHSQCFASLLLEQLGQPSTSTLPQGPAPSPPRQPLTRHLQCMKSSSEWMPEHLDQVNHGQDLSHMPLESHQTLCRVIEVVRELVIEEAREGVVEECWCANRCWGKIPALRVQNPFLWMIKSQD